MAEASVGLADNAKAQPGVLFHRNDDVRRAELAHVLNQLSLTDSEAEASSQSSRRRRVAKPGKQVGICDWIRASVWWKTGCRPRSLFSIRCQPSSTSLRACRFLPGASDERTLSSTSERRATRGFPSTRAVSEDAGKKLNGRRPQETDQVAPELRNCGTWVGKQPLILQAVILQTFPKSKSPGSGKRSPFAPHSDRDPDNEEQGPVGAFRRLCVVAFRSSPFDPCRSYTPSGRRRVRARKYYTATER